MVFYLFVKTYLIFQAEVAEKDFAVMTVVHVWSKDILTAFAIATNVGDQTNAFVQMSLPMDRELSFFG